MRLVILVCDTPNGAIGLRASALFARVPRVRFKPHIVFRRRGNVHALPEFLRALRLRPAVVYIQNIGWAGAVAGVIAKVVGRSRLIVETGDPLPEHFEAIGKPKWLCSMIGVVERAVLSMADEVVVRGSRLADHFRQRGIHANYHWLPDGVDLTRFRPQATEEAKSALGLTGKYVIGTVGRLAWNSAQQLGYGWDIIEGLAMTDDRSVVGLVVGEGEGRVRLQRLAEDVKISDRVLLPGWVPHEQIPLYINAMDVCVSTQTNDPVGWGRTTAKLPEFMACGRFIVATEVGEAAALLTPKQLLPYRGLRDSEHPIRLARRVGEIRYDQSAMAVGRRNRDVAQSMFDYDVIAAKLVEIVDRARTR